MADQDRSHKLAEMAFTEALQKRTQSNPKEIAFFAATDDTIEELIDAFEASAQVDAEGHECWFARDIQELLDYAKWDNFVTVIAKARQACEQAGQTCEDHFADVGKMVSLGSGAESEIDDIALSRYV